MQTGMKTFCLGIIMLIAPFCAAQSTPSKISSKASVIPLTVKPGVPIRVVLEKPVRIKRVGTPVEGRLVQPVYVFDRKVISANSTVLGSVTKIDPVSRRKRLMALANGNLTPFHEAHIEFTTLVFTNGKQFPIQTEVSPGTTDVIRLVAGGKNKKTGLVHEKVGEVRRQIAQTGHQAVAAIKAPHKLKRVEAIFSAQLPFHRQFLPAGTQFTATLKNPLTLGTEKIPPQELIKMGSKIPPASTVRVWLATPLSSARDRRGSAVEAIVSQPLFSKGHQLILPEGSRLEGMVTQAVPARRLSRNGKLRFTFQRIELPHGPTRKVEAGLQAASVAKTARLKIDSEGGTHAVSSKTKYIMPAIDMLLATSSFDGDSQQRAIQEGGGQGGDVAGGAVRGGVGFGLMGSLIAMAARSQPVTAGFAFYGAAMSVYFHIVARGNEVVFPKDTAMQIRFGTHESQAHPSNKNTAAPTGKPPARHTT
jgi:hypothetical protein